MTRRSRCRSAAALLLAAAAAACLSSAPPAPPVRWFDPTPAPPPAVATGVLAVRVVAAAHLGREFAVRVGARELAFDGEHGWIAAPRELVAAALRQALGDGDARAGVAEVTVEAFELDVTGPPRAHVRLSVRPPNGAVQVADAWAEAADRSPPAFAAAMAAALGAAVEKVGRVLDGRGAAAATGT